MSRQQLVCPSCGESDGLGTAEIINGHAGAAFFVDDLGEIEIEHDGYTDIWWDSAISVGVHCRNCDWGIDNYGPSETIRRDLDQLVPKKDGSRIVEFNFSFEIDDEELDDDSASRLAGDLLFDYVSETVFGENHPNVTIMKED